MGVDFNKMDIDTVVIFGAGSFLAKKIIKRINFKKAICFSKTLNKNSSKSKKILFFKSYLGNKEKINKLLNKKKITVIFFNNTTFDNLILNKSHSEISKEISENIINTFDNAREISKVLVKNNFGRLIFVNSTRALKGDVGTSGYSISKHGILGMMKSFSKELSRFNVTSNCLSLGFFESPLFKKISKKTRSNLLGKCDNKSIGDIDSLANAIKFISNSNYVTGSTVFVDGGYQ